MATKKRSSLQTYLAKNQIRTFRDVFAASAPRPAEDSAKEEKKNYAERLSDAVAVLVADRLRGYFPGVLPNSDGTGNESPARTGKGVKMLDVNYSTPQLGLGLGVSVKTLNFRDRRTKRYTKNATRIDNELRAEAMDYHDRQPFSVLIALVLLPIDSCDDGDPGKPRSSWSSFAHFVTVLRHRVGRASPKDEAQMFERGFVGLYSTTDEGPDDVSFFELDHTPPQFGRPTQLYDLDGVLQLIVRTYDSRNRVLKPWESEDTQAVPFSTLLDEDRVPSTDDDSDEDEE